MAQKTILLIDYDPRSIESIKGPLEEVGYQVAVAGDGVAGMEAFEQLRPAMVFVEAMIPKKHGFEVCQDLKKTELGKQTPIAIVTAVYRGQKYRSQAFHNYHCDEYLEKPVDREALLAVTKKFVEERAASMEAVQRQRAEEADPVVTPASPAAAPAAAAAPGASVADPAGAQASPAAAAPAAQPAAPVAASGPASGMGQVGMTTPGKPGVESLAWDDLLEEPPAPAAKKKSSDSPVAGLSDDEIMERLDSILPGDALGEPAEIVEADPVTGDADDGEPRQMVAVDLTEDDSMPDLDAALDALVPEELRSSPTPAEAEPAAQAQTPQPEPTAAEPDAAPEPAQPAATAPAATAQPAPRIAPENEDISLTDELDRAVDTLHMGADPQPVQKPAAQETAPGPASGQGQPATEAPAENLISFDPDRKKKKAQADGEDAVAATAAAVQAAIEADAAPVEPGLDGKRSGMPWMIAIAALVVLGAGVGAYFMLQGGSPGGEPASRTQPAPSTPAPVESQASPNPAAAGSTPTTEAGGESVSKPETQAATNDLQATRRPAPAEAKPQTRPEPASAGSATATNPTAERRTPPPAKVESKPAPSKPAPRREETKASAERWERTPPAENTARGTESKPSTSRSANSAAVPVETAASRSAEQEAQPSSGVANPSSIESDPPAVTRPVEQPASQPTAVSTDQAPSRVETQPTREPVRQPEAEQLSRPETRPVTTPVAQPVSEPKPELPAVPRTTRGQLVDLTSVDQEPQPVSKAAPVYPPAAKRARRQGEVELMLLINENGQVADIEVVRGVKMFEKSAIAAAEQWTYRPAQKDGVDVKVWIAERIAFAL